MNSRERVLSAFARKGYDRIPVKHEGTPEINNQLLEYFKLANMEQLLRVLGDDFRYAEPVYIGPELKTFPDGSSEGYYGERYNYVQYGNGRYLEAVHLALANIDDLEVLKKWRWPTADWFDFSTIKEQCRAITKNYAVCFGGAGDMDFINGISRARGMEEVLMDLADENPAYLFIMQKRFEFVYHTHERALQAAEGGIDFTHIGEDLGTQISPMISMDTFDKFFAPKYGAYFKMVHQYGARTIMHMCGCVHHFLPRLIELGLDVYDVVQPAVPEQDIAELEKNYGDKLCFQGSMDVQKELAFGTPADVSREVKKRLELFPKGGLFIGPSHAIQPGSPLENVIAMYRSASSLMENIDDSVRSIELTGVGDGKMNLSKMF